MIQINDHGNRNRISVHPDYEQTQFALLVKGDDNEVEFAQPTSAQDFNIINVCLFGSGNRIRFGHIYSNSLTLHAESGLLIDCGNGTSFNRVFISSNEPAEIRIGDDCLFASDIKIYPTDFHKVYADGERINSTRPIVIGNKVWIADNVIVLKGASIGNGSVVGAGAVAAGSIPPRSLAVGNPLRIVRSDIDWEP